MPTFRSRGRDREGNKFVIMLQRYATLLVTLIVLAGGFSTMATYYARADDVRKQFRSVTHQLEVADIHARKERYEDELFRLRLVTSPDNSTRALIQRYETKLNAAEARLRDLQKER